MGELDRAAISVRLQQTRVEAGLSQAEIADLLGVHWRTVQDWESPKKAVVPFDRLGEWAAIVKVTREWLLHGDTEVTQPDAILQALREQQAELRRRFDELEQLVRADREDSV